MWNIKVDPNSYIPAVITLTRNILIALCGNYFVLSDDDATKIATGLVGASLAAYGTWKSYRNNEKLKTMEPFVPDSIATTK